MRQTTLSSVRARGSPAVHLRFDMSPAILGLCAAVAALILVPVIIWFWLDRATKVEHEGPRVLPLFTSSGMTVANEERDEADRDGSEAHGPTAAPPAIKPAIPKAVNGRLQGRL